MTIGALLGWFVVGLPAWGAAALAVVDLLERADDRS